jgi:sirohydrochlorin cobaltochelatase
MDENHTIRKDSRTAIVLVTTGTVREGAGTIADACTDVFKSAYPDAVIRTAVASELVRQLMREAGTVLKSPIGAIAELIDEGFSKIIVQPLFVTPGSGLHDLYAVTTTFNNFAGRHSSVGIEGVLVGKPLLMEPDDYRKTADAIISYFGAPAEDEALVLVSSVDEAGADPSLCQLQLILDEKAHGHTVIGSAAGYPGIDWVQSRLKHIKAGKVTLAPLALIPGKHSEYEIGGDSPKSWKKVLEAAGYDVTVSDKILAQSEEIAGLFIESVAATGKTHGFL